MFTRFSGVTFSLALATMFVQLVLPEATVASARTGLDPAAGNGPSKDQRIVQVLSRLTFGAHPGDVERVKKMGINAFIDEQFAPDNIDDAALARRLEKLPTLNLSTSTLAEQYNPPKPTPTPVPAQPLVSPNAKPAAAEMKMDPAGEAAKTMSAAEMPMAAEVRPAATPTPKPAATPVPKNPNMVVTELQRAKLLRAVYSKRQLSEVMVDFWENHFSIFANKDADRWMMTAFDRDSIRPFAFTRFRDLLGATAHSPAMLYYLDNWQSSVTHEYPATKDKPARKTGGINENYARELMELHTLGVDGGYTQKDVQEVARCFTGWTIRKPGEEGTFTYNPAAHDNGEKIVMGVRVPAGGGLADGERVLDILAKSPATARFISTKLARRFLGDDPPATAVDRAAKVFLSTDGSIAATVRSLITGPEFFSTAAFQNKVKSPFEFVASALRITGAETDAAGPILDWIKRMGQPVYGRVTPDGYPDVGREWLSNNDLLTRFNFASALGMNTIKGTRIDAVKLVSADGDAAARAAHVLLLDQESAGTRKELETLLKGPATSMSPAPVPAGTATKWAASVPNQADGTKAVSSELIALALGSPEFQRK